GFPRRRVAEVMSRNPGRVALDTPLAEVVARLVELDHTSLPVVDADGRVLGVVDEVDLLEKGLAKLKLGDRGLTVQTVMRTTSTVRDNDPLPDAAHVMHSRDLKRVAVVDAQGKLVGVLARLDLLAALAAGHPAPAAHLEGPVPVRHEHVRDLME